MKPIFLIWHAKIETIAETQFLPIHFYADGTKDDAHKRDAHALAELARDQLQAQQRGTLPPHRNIALEHAGVELSLLGNDHWQHSLQEF